MKTTAFLALLVLGLLVAPLVPDAQPRRRIPLVGVLTPYATPTAVSPHRDLDSIGIPILRLPSRPHDTKARWGEEGTCCGPMMGWM